MLNEKQQKYDRQLRIWQEHGQQALESSNVLLINASVTGVECLKNLILPCIGSFTVLDDQKITENDLENNFYLTADSVGQNKAEAVCKLLNELNQDVKGQYCDQKVEQLLSLHQDFFTKFNLIIASSVNKDTLIKLSDLCNLHQISLVVVVSMGFFGYIRLQLPDHYVIESHPENQSDLRLNRPWKELIKHVEDYQVDGDIDSMYRSNIPFPILLLKYYIKNQQFIDEDPKLKIQKLRDLLKKESPIDAENYQEAIRYAYKLFETYNIPDNVLKCFQSKECVNLKFDSDEFWFLVRALKLFIESKNELPLLGSLPDMKSDTEQYIRLQQIYKQRAEDDYKLIKQFTDQLCLQFDRNLIETSVIERFCKNSRNFFVKKYFSIKQEYIKQEYLQNQLQIKDDFDHWYASYRALLEFRQRFQRLPGQIDIWKEDIQAIHQILQAGFNIPQNEQKKLEQHASELVRSGGFEVHAVAAYVGGLASQECLKILTKQFIPVNNTIIYDGMKSLVFVKNKQ